MAAWDRTSEGFTVKELSRIVAKSKQAIQKRADKEAWPYSSGPRRAKQFPLETLPEDVKTAIRSQEAGMLESQKARSEEQRSVSLYNKDRNAVHVSTGSTRTVDPGSTGTALPAVIGESALAEWYAKPESCREEAQRRLGMVNKARSIKGRSQKCKTQALTVYAQSQGVSLGALYKYLAAADRAMSNAVTNGGDVVMSQILALTPEYGNNGGCRAFDPAAISYAKALYLDPNQLNLSDVYKHVTNEAQIQGWSCGSYDTLKRVIDKEVNVNLQVLARKGTRRYLADCELKILRDYREIWPNFMWCGDHHIFDVFVKGPGGKVVRPWLTAWMDMASRSFMGWCISFAPNSRTVALALSHAISEKNDEHFPQHGLPSSVYIDNGKDYRCKYLNGEEIEIGKIDYPEIMERFVALGIDPYYIDLEYDPEERAWMKKRGSMAHQVKSVRVGGVYARLGIHQRYATAYHPWAKPIERAFRDVVQGFSREQPGWCGSGHEQRPEKLTWELRRGLILGWQEFCERWYQWVLTRNATPHNGHGMDGRSPNDVFLSFGAPEAIDPELTSFALLKKDQVKVHNWGFNLVGEEYELDVPADLRGAAILNRIINRWATVLYDPDFKTIRVYVDGEFMCCGKRLRRASFVRQDDPVMVDKLKLEAYQRQLNRGTLALIKSSAPAETVSEETALLELSSLSGHSVEEETAANAESSMNATNADCIPMTAEEKYRQILRRIATEEPLSDLDAAWREEYEQTQEYQDMQQLYEAELSYMKHKAGRTCGGES